LSICLLGIRSQLCFSLFVAFRPADRPGEHDHPGQGRADGPQLLSTAHNALGNSC
jgi:hypothetical protein